MIATATSQAKRRSNTGRKRFSLVDDQEYEPIPLEYQTDTPRTAEERITKIVPLMVKRLTAFARSLRHRERAQFDVADALQEMWYVLLEKDRYYDSTKAAYTTFAVEILNQHLGAMRNRSHVVHSPRDTASILKRDGSSEHRVTAIKQAISDVGTLTTASMEAVCPIEESTLDTAANRDSGRTARKLIGSHLMQADPVDREILKCKWGLFGTTACDIPEIATKLGLSTAEVDRRSKLAEKQLYLELQSAGIVYT